MAGQKITSVDVVRKVRELTNAAVTAKRSQTTPTGDSGQAVGQPFKNPLETLGDLIVGGADGVLRRLGVGTDGQVLTADSGATFGVTWADPTGGGGPGTGQYRAYVLVSDGAGGFDFIDDGTGHPVESLEDLV